MSSSKAIPALNGLPQSQLKTMLKIQITRRSTHPHFGGIETEVWEFKMCDGPLAEKEYTRLRAEADQSNGFVSLEISIVHVRG